MNFIHSTVVSLLALIFVLLSSTVLAGPGHDHGETAQQTTGTLLPRFSAVSEDLELVGIVSGKHVMLYLDHFSDNRPINDAQIEIDIEGNTYKAEKHADGEYELTLKDILKPGVIAITATIQTGVLTDLLVTELDLHADEMAQSSYFSFKSIVGLIAAGLLALIAVGAFFRIRQKQTVLKDTSA